MSTKWGEPQQALGWLGSLGVGVKLCATCGSENGPECRFCGQCGALLAQMCQDCGADSALGQRFCAQCGKPLPGSLLAEVSEVPRVVPIVGSGEALSSLVGVSGTAELRRVSVVFVDLVGFTSWSESQDAEDVRGLLSGYFEVARTVISRYGGVVEKFIGDAVMAVWGVVTAQEDDAERSVRAALEVVAAVAEFGERRQVAGLRARAGVVSGQVAAWEAAGEGLVTGDRVNTAARVQGVAGPGEVLVDEATKTASQAAISYAPAGEHVVKGKVEPLVLWRATRVVANVGGAQRVDGLEAGFAGRGRELALVKELFHATAEGGRARLVGVSGVAGVGKSRLGWEFEKYIDGLAVTVSWHRGRCLSYGDGVAFWALAEMVRQRFGIAEDDAPEVAEAKLVEGLARWVPDPVERDFVTPRLGVLVGAAEVELSGEELFAGWRLFIERMAATNPVVMLIEDLHWADPGLLSFLEYLLDWSAGLPIFMLTFARPELAEHRPGWLADRRNATTVHLDPLPESVLDRLLDDLVPEMPAAAKQQIAGRAQGIPLYAVETIRALVDRDIVVPHEGIYRLVGELDDDLDVPATLTSLLAARLDGLPADERDLVKSLAVLGGSFARNAVAAVTDAPADQTEELLRTLVRKEILTVRSDSLSPEHGQYAFTQTMLRTVAHDTLTKRERRTRHLAVAKHLRSTFPDDGEEIAELIAAHYHDAYTAAPNDPDADIIRDDAVAAYARAGQRAGTIGATDAAEQAYRSAASLAATEPDRTKYTERAASMAQQAGRFQDALDLYQTSVHNHQTFGRPQRAARLARAVGECLRFLGHGEQGAQHMRQALETLDDHPADPAVPELHAALGAVLTLLGGHHEEATVHLEKALTLAAANEVRPEVLSSALIGRSWLLEDANRIIEAEAMLLAAVKVAHEHSRTFLEARARANLGVLRHNSDLPEAAEEMESALVMMRRIGSRAMQALCVQSLSGRYALEGRWDLAEAATREMLSVAPNDHARAALTSALIPLLCARGQYDEVSARLPDLQPLLSSDDSQDRAIGEGVQATVALAQGLPQKALTIAAEAARRAIAEQGIRSDGFRLAWPLAMQAALKIDQLQEAGRLLGLVADAPVGHVPPYLSAQLARYRALVNFALGHDDDVEVDLRLAIADLDDLGYPYWFSRAQVDLAGWLTRNGRGIEADPLLAQARETFTRLGAQPDLDRTLPLMTIGVQE